MEIGRVNDGSLCEYSTKFLFSEENLEKVKELCSVLNMAVESLNIPLSEFLRKPEVTNFKQVSIGSTANSVDCGSLATLGILATDVEQQSYFLTNVAGVYIREVILSDTGDIKKQGMLDVRYTASQDEEERLYNTMITVFLQSNLFTGCQFLLVRELDE